MEQSLEVLKIIGVAVKSSAKKFYFCKEALCGDNYSNKKGGSKWRI
jgi:hypothetical protein